MAAAPAAAMGAAPVRRGQPQLFLDDELVDRARGVGRTFQRPRKDPGPLLAIGEELGAPATLEANGSILYDERRRLWVMYALAYAGSLYDSNRPERSRLLRFTSHDGLRWSAGERVDFDRTGPGGDVGALDVCSFEYDRASGAYPYRGWIFVNDLRPPGMGAYFVRSRDGLTWERVRQVTIAESVRIPFAGGELVGPADVQTFTRDPVTGRYLASFKFYSHALLGPHDSRARSRAYAWLDSMDEPIDFSKIRLSLVPDPDGRGEFYSSTGWPYADRFLGTLRVFDAETGRASLELISSREGLSWRRHGPFLPNAREGSADGGYMTEMSTPPLRIGQELVFYYGASAWGKNHGPVKRVTGGGIFRARLRVDGFAAIDSGRFTTRPLLSTGRRVIVNARGRVVVETLDRQGRRTGRVTLRGDSLEHRAGTVPPLGRLRFTVTDGELYSFSLR